MDRCKGPPQLLDPLYLVGAGQIARPTMGAFPGRNGNGRTDGRRCPRVAPNIARLSEPERFAAVKPGVTRIAAVTISSRRSRLPVREGLLMCYASLELFPQPIPAVPPRGLQQPHAC